MKPAEQDNKPGIIFSQAAGRLLEYGPNELPERKPPGLLRIFSASSKARLCVSCLPPPSGRWCTFRATVVRDSGTVIVNTADIVPVIMCYRPPVTGCPGHSHCRDVHTRTERYTAG